MNEKAPKPTKHVVLDAELSHKIQEYAMKTDRSFSSSLRIIVARSIDELLEEANFLQPNP